MIFGLFKRNKNTQQRIDETIVNDVQENKETKKLEYKSVTPNISINYGGAPDNIYRTNPFLRMVVDYFNNSFSGLYFKYSQPDLFSDPETSFLRRFAYIYNIFGDAFFALGSNGKIYIFSRNEVQASIDGTNYVLVPEVLSFYRKQGILFLGTIKRFASHPFLRPFSISKIETLRMVLARIMQLQKMTLGIAYAGHPSSIIAPKEGYITIDADTREALRNYMNSMNAGQNFGRIEVLTQPVDLIKFEADWKSLEINQLFINDFRSICVTFGIPPVLLLDVERSTYNNISEARMRFYSDTLIPLAYDFSDFISRSFGFMIEPNIDAILSISDLRFRNVDAIIKMLQAGIIKVAEARRFLQL